MRYTFTRTVCVEGCRWQLGVHVVVFCFRSPNSEGAIILAKGHVSVSPLFDSDIRRLGEKKKGGGASHRIF